MIIGPVIPVLRMFDPQKVRDFYSDFLGFTWLWEHRFADDLPLYAEIAREGCRLHLTEHHGDATPGSAIRIPVSDVDALANELSAKRYRYARPQPENKPWGMRELTVIDPSGNRIVFYQELKA